MHEDLLTGPTLLEGDITLLRREILPAMGTQPRRGSEWHAAHSLSVTPARGLNLIGDTVWVHHLGDTRSTIRYTKPPAPSRAGTLPARPADAVDMPKVLHARPPVDAAEERRLRKLAGSRRAPAEHVVRARTIVQSWDGAPTATIAARLGCHPQTVRDRIARFNADGFQSIAARGSGGRRPRLTEAQRRELIALIERPAPRDAAARHQGTFMDGRIDGRAVRQSSPWTLDTLVEAARSRGIPIGRSHLRRILLAAGVQWCPTSSWTSAQMPVHERQTSSSR